MALAATCAACAACAAGAAVVAPARTGDRVNSIVFVIDRSRSMQGEKLDAVKNAAAAAVDTLEEFDQVAVVVFDSEALVAVPLQQVANGAVVRQQIAAIMSGGGTDMRPGLASALELLKKTPNTTRHVIVFSDGETPELGLMEIVQGMTVEEITVSTVAVDGADRNLLTDIANLGRGKAYVVEDLAVLPEVFVNETTRVTGAGRRKE